MTYAEFKFNVTNAIVHYIYLLFNQPQLDNISFWHIMSYHGTGHILDDISFILLTLNKSSANPSKYFFRFDVHRAGRLLYMYPS